MKQFITECDCPLCSGSTYHWKLRRYRVGLPVMCSCTKQVGSSYIAYKDCPNCLGKGMAPIQLRDFTYLRLVSKPRQIGKLCLLVSAQSLKGLGLSLSFLLQLRYASMCIHHTCIFYFSPDVVCQAFA